MANLVRFITTTEATEKMCGDCGAYPATHYYDVWLTDEWVEEVDGKKVST